jgi:phosphoglucomutase
LYFLILFYFRFTFDAMHAVAGAYATPIFVDKLGASPVWFSPLTLVGSGYKFI